MIRKVHIQNFKSLADFEMELGRMNVIIGANGSGKTNILEGIAMGAAAAADKLDYEFLGARIRVTKPEFMRTGFPGKADKQIKISFWGDDQSAYMPFVIEFDGKIDRQWKNVGGFVVDQHRRLERLNALFAKMADHFERFEKPDPQLQEEIDQLNAQFQVGADSWSETSKFLIYSPENYFLRRFEEPSQLYPLGVRGEGIFHELKRIFIDKKRKKQQEEISGCLQLLDWFEEMDVPADLMSTEYRISIRDRFIDPKLSYFDQRSANEGFLMILFYLVLLTSPETPRFFAIENIDAALNPKMCWELIKVISSLAKKHKKQVIVTTHNASSLNGLNLNDDEQRLFVADSNKKGETKVERIIKKSDTNLMLSELWTRGYIGGLPDNF